MELGKPSFLVDKSLGGRQTLSHIDIFPRRDLDVDAAQ